MNFQDKPKLDQLAVISLLKKVPNYLNTMPNHYTHFNSILNLSVETQHYNITPLLSNYLHLILDIKRINLFNKLVGVKKFVLRITYFL
jgi:hypothetical protein